MSAIIKNQMILDQYKLLLNNIYAEPQNEEILCPFLELGYTATGAISKIDEWKIHWGSAGKKWESGLNTLLKTVKSL